MQRRPSFALVVALVSVACSTHPSSTDEPAGAPPCSADTDCAGGTPLCDATAKACVALPPGNEIGYRDGSSSSVAFTEIYRTTAAAGFVDLAFHPERTDELWVVGYGDDSVHIGHGVGSDAATWERRVDPDAMHFAHKPPALAMGSKTSSTGDGWTWGTCGDNDNSQSTDNADGSANLFMGPSLFSLDLSVFAKATPGGLGSHLDMNHESPFCRGIAHEKDNVFWVFNAYDSAIDRYDFEKDHGPGHEDHSATTVYRYAEGALKGSTDGTPSHVFFDPADGFLYVADTGNRRVVRLDTKSGKKSGDLDRVLEPLADEGAMKGADLEVVVPPGVLAAPSGIEVRDDLVYVTDAATSTFHVFDKTGAELRSLATDLPAKSLAGFTFGADGKVYFVDRLRSRVLRIDPQ